ncbi:hypothetical protein SAMN02927924_01391 [Sphingobium faniae]|nr:hypothetical protein SAMN02927924_01391 [Sphingobium faniae]
MTHEHPYFSVTQEDRDAAADLWGLLTAPEIRSGKCDQSIPVQAFARHRDTAEKRTEQWMRMEQNEPPIYCPVCGSCGDEGCGCLSKCLYPPVSPLEDSERPTIYVRFSDDGERIRKWAFIPFDDGVRYSPEPRKDTQP